MSHLEGTMVLSDVHKWLAVVSVFVFPVAGSLALKYGFPFVPCPSFGAYLVQCAVGTISIVSVLVSACAPR